jgi:PEP-CTERM motif-containing protein
MLLPFLRSPMAASRRAAWAGALLLLSLSVARVEADAIRMTEGIVSTDARTPLTSAFVELIGPDIRYEDTYPFSPFSFVGTQPAWDYPNLPLVPGTEVEFDAFVPPALGPDDILVFRGSSFRGTAEIQIHTGRIAVAPLVTLPFTLVGSLHGCIPSLPDSCSGGDPWVDVPIVASGTVRAFFSEVADDPRLLQLEAVRYEVSPVPEPSTLLLLAAGLTALAARASSCR